MLIFGMINQFSQTALKISRVCDPDPRLVYLSYFIVMIICMMRNFYISLSKSFLCITQTIEKVMEKLRLLQNEETFSM